MRSVSPSRRPFDFLANPNLEMRAAHAIPFAAAVACSGVFACGAPDTHPKDSLDSGDSATAPPDAGSLSADVATSDATEAGEGAAGDAGKPPPDCPSGRTPYWGQGLSPSSWLAQGTIDWGGDNAAPASDATMGPVLRIQFPLGSSSLNAATPAGTEFRIKLPTDRVLTSAFLTYWVRFEPSFPLASVNALIPGLCGGVCPGAKVAGTSTTGWSFRPKWGFNGQGSEYTYVVPVMPGRGSDLGTASWMFTVGTWHHVAQETIMNTAANADGILRIWWDVAPPSPPTYQITTLIYRTDSANVDTLLFSAIFIPDTTPTPVSTFIDFARLVVCQ
jgi:hypothetical protein